MQQLTVLRQPYTPKKPKWYSKTGLIRHQLNDSRVVCPACFGKKSAAGMLVDTCEWCQRSTEEPCEAHKCLRCGGTGAVCPACRGDRFVRFFEWDGQRNKGQVDYRRCDTCNEGNNWNPAQERLAIERWIRKHGVQQHELKAVE